MDESLNQSVLFTASTLLPRVVTYLYILSTGPVIWLGRHRVLPLDLYMAYLAPLSWLASAGVLPEPVARLWVKMWHRA